ncbi:hypothetical protein BT93_F0739 [Corymbia citriodora subsp. variegata]|nr:hypothetical protein BT93_F0739 [Corymbia citriodora subsp. variegata]
MKFWKILKSLIDEAQPDWRDKYLSYKDLKKWLNLTYPKDSCTTCLPPVKRLRLDPAEGSRDCTVEAVDFVELLDGEINKINEFFIDQEEGHIIKREALQDRVAEAEGMDNKLMEVRREMVDFHGEMILLQYYSALNCIGLVKIIKKYDKRSGALICVPFIQKVLQQPFCRTDVLKKFVKECEIMLDQLPFKNHQDMTVADPRELEVEIMESMYKKLTLSALRVFELIRSGSSTVSTFSLPPLHKNQKGED